MKHFLQIAAVVCLLALSAGASLLQAQNAQFSVQTISVASLASVTKLSPDSHTLAVYNHYAIYDDAPSAETIPIRLIDIRTNTTLGVLSGNTDWVAGLAFNSDGSRLASFHRNGDLLLWDVAGQRLIKTIRTYMLGGSWVQFLNDDKTVLIRSGQFVLATLDTDTGAITRLFGFHMDSYDEFSQQYAQFPGSGDIMIAAAAASPDGRWLVTSTGNDAVLLWDMQTGKQWTLREKSEQPGGFNIRKLVFSSDSSQLTYFDGSDKQTHVWDVLKRTEIGARPFGAVSFALAPDNTTLAWADRATESIYLAAAGTDTPVKLVALPDALQVGPGVTTLDFSQDGTQLVVGGLVALGGADQIYVINLTS